MAAASSVAPSRISEVVPTPLAMIVRLGTFNVNRAVEAEKLPATCFEARVDKICAAIIAMACDIVCLQELRELPKTRSVLEIMALLVRRIEEATGRRMVPLLVKRNPSALAFCTVILYDSERFVAQRQATHWVSETPEVCSGPGFGATIQSVELAPVRDGKRIANAEPLVIACTHFPLAEADKALAVRTLCSAVPRAYDASRTIVACGDFNLFMDRDGAQHLAAMRAGGFEEVAERRFTPGGAPAAGTFVGYSYDAFKAPGEPTNPLDRVFVRAGAGGLYLPRGPLEVHRCGYAADGSNRDTLPSDHLPVVVTLEY